MEKIKRKKKDIRINKIVIFMIMLNIFFTFNNLLIDNVKSENNDSPAYDYYMPINSFGSPIKTVNWSYFTTLFNQHTSWDLEYKRYSYSDLINGNQYLTVQKWWNNTGFWKINLLLEVPVDIYYASFTFNCDLIVLDYIIKDNYEVRINYTANNTEIYNIYFNYSDIMNIPNLIINKGIVNNKFYFKFSKHNILSGIYNFDPEFGETSSGSGSVGIENYIAGATYTMGGDDGIGTSITVSLVDITGSNSVNVKCNIYKTDNTPLTNGETEEKSCALTTTPAWFTFNFLSSPSLSASTSYKLVVWGGSSSGTPCARSVGSSPDLDFRDSETYGSWVNPLVPVDYPGTSHLSIYCTYTLDSGWSNTCPYGDSVSITNNSNSISLTVGSISLDIHDADGNTTSGTMICPISSNSDSWSNLGNGTRTLTLSTLVCNTQYKVWFNFSDEYCTRNYFFYFTTVSCPPYENNCPFSNNPNPSNQSTGISITIGLFSVYVGDLNGNTTSGSIWVNNSDTNSWSNEGNGSKTCNLSTLTYSTTYTIWVNFTDSYGCTVKNMYWFTTGFQFNLSIVIYYPINQSDNYFISNVTVEFFGTGQINYNISLSNGLYRNGSTSNNTSFVWNFIYYLIDGNYTIYFNVSDNNDYLNETIWFNVLNPELDGVLLSGLSLDSSVILFILWGFCVYFILFGKGNSIYKVIIGIVLIYISVNIMSDYSELFGNGLFLVFSFCVSILGILKPIIKN